MTEVNTSESPTSQVVNSKEPTPLIYEETPIIEPIYDTPAATLPDSLKTPELPPKRSGMPFLLKTFLLAGLFVAGIAVSSFFRPFITNFMTKFETPNSTVNDNKPPVISESQNMNTKTTDTPTVTRSQIPKSLAEGFVYEILSSSNEHIGATVLLPDGVVEPICDGSGCASYGTYLPGGTRLTFAYKAYPKAIEGFSRAIITDASGKSFSAGDASVSGKLAREYNGEFVGITTGGYRFNRMHGYMIQLTPAKTLEINHFTPSGITADFTSDEKIFSQIIQSLIFSYPSS